MVSAREYRQFAQQCFEWAMETEGEVRQSFLNLARDWTIAALALELYEQPKNNLDRSGGNGRVPQHEEGSASWGVAEGSDT